MNKVKIIECPRDAMQGIKSHFISTEAKANYINSLLKVGFDTIDFGSFVSPKAIPQMRDTAAVLARLDLSQTTSKLLAIVANVRGANSNKEVVAYLSMGFGNPYGDPWNVEIVSEWTEKLSGMGVKILSLSDTIGSSTPAVISHLFSNLIPTYPAIEFGAHLHTSPSLWHEKVHAAFHAGCKRFDGAIKGYGGCPMAKDELTGNMPTEKLISYFTEQKVVTGIKPMSFESAYNQALKIF
jgi:hydroxymethylglutaryl-CoA lyase